MKYILFISFLLTFLTSSAQQVFELCAGESKTVTYYSISNGIGTNIWAVNGITYLSEDLTYTYTQPGNYNIVLRRENGPCYTEQTIQILVTSCPGVIYWVPNTFTPDGNEYNNVFTPIFSNKRKIENYSLSIYNRWGEIVFETKDVDFGWDGFYKNKMAESGTYIWQLQFTNLFNSKKELINGHVNLLR